VGADPPIEFSGPHGCQWNHRALDSSGVLGMTRQHRPTEVSPPPPSVWLHPSPRREPVALEVFMAVGVDSDQVD
jgi:hypothetical protein